MTFLSSTLMRFDVTLPDVKPKFGPDPLKTSSVCRLPRDLLFVDFVLPAAAATKDDGSPELTSFAQLRTS